MFLFSKNANKTRNKELNRSAKKEPKRPIITLNMAPMALVYDIDSAIKRYKHINKKGN